MRAALGALTPAQRRPKPVLPRPLVAELAAAQRDNAQLRHRLDRAEAIIAVQRKLADLLGIPLEPTAPDSAP